MLGFMKINGKHPCLLDLAEKENISPKTWVNRMLEKQAYCQCVELYCIFNS
jgi:hypothetical protein